jgi:hypothetical protein
MSLVAGLGDWPRHFSGGRMEQRQKVILDKQSDGSVRYEIKYYDDATPYLNHAKRERDKEAALRANKKSEYKKMASVDWATAMRIKAEHGVDPFNLRTPEDTRKYFRILQRDYPQYLCTNKRVYRPPAPKPKTVGGREKFANIPAECLK